MENFFFFFFFFSILDTNFLFWIDRWNLYKFEKEN